MAHKRTQRQYLNNAVLDGKGVVPADAPLVESLASLSNSRSKHGLVVPEFLEFTATDQVFDVVDSGGAAGGNFSQQMFTLPLTERVAIISSYLAVEVKSIGASLADGGYSFGVGTDAAVGTLSADEINFLSAALSLTVSSGVSPKTIATGPLVITYLDGNPALPVYFNGFVPDASISADGTVTLDVVFRALFVNVALGDTV